MYLGIDVGSIATKAVVINNKKEIIASFLVRTGGAMQGAIFAVTNEVCRAAGITEKDIKRRVATGYGRKNVGNAEKIVTEITAHAEGMRFCVPDARIIIDIGGQDTKVIALCEDGHVDDFFMNDKCAAGTGRFLELMAGILDVSFEEFGACALRPG